MSKPLLTIIPNKYTTDICYFFIISTYVIKKYTNGRFLDINGIILYLKERFFNLFITSLLEIYNLNRSKTPSKTILFINYFFIRLSSLLNLIILINIVSLIFWQTLPKPINLIEL